MPIASQPEPAMAGERPLAEREVRELVSFDEVFREALGTTWRRPQRGSDR